ncbi:MAG: iron ABC transporter permease [Euryarchaeota archaeon]|nr:iron ABC transporter permease [Euryarchaeota archaeon]
MTSDKLIQTYDNIRRRKFFIGLFIFILLFISIVVCTSMGVTDSSIKTVLKTILNALSGKELDNNVEKVILNLRLPRTILGVVAGFGLSVSGGVMQGITRNQLVSPFTVGISSACAFGASLSIVYGIGFLGGSQIGTVINAFLFAIICAGLVFTIALRIGLSPSSIVLTGIAMNYLFQAMSTAVQFTADDAKLSQVVAWTFGSVNGAAWDEVRISLSLTAISFFLMITQSKSLTVISTMDDDISSTMGINPKSVRIICSVLSAIVTASIISFTGVIGFVGLAAPHIARTISDNDYSYFLPIAGMIGSLLVLIADTIGRTLFSPIMIPVGIVISFIGVPIFVHQVILNNKG